MADDTQFDGGGEFRVAMQQGVDVFLLQQGFEGIACLVIPGFELRGPPEDIISASYGRVGECTTRLCGDYMLRITTALRPATFPSSRE